LRRDTNDLGEKECGMITVLGNPRRHCDGITRRQSMEIGALSALAGFSLTDLLRAEKQRPASAPPGRAKNVIVLFLAGGAPSQDMYDLKPTAPADIRGEFKPIATSVPGIQVSEHLPLLAKWMHKVALVRSVHHQAGCHNALPMFTGSEEPVTDLTATKETYPPSMGSVCEYLRQHGRDPHYQEAYGLPAYVCLPHYFGWGDGGDGRGPGPYAGFLGKRYDPLFSEARPWLDKEAKRGGYPGYLWRGEPYLADNTLADGLTLDRLHTRRSLVQQLDSQLRRLEGQHRVANFARTQHQAYSLFTSSKLKAAFNLDEVEPRRRDRYGRTLFGNSTLVGTRLLEAGVRLVNVAWEWYHTRLQVPDDPGWDTHWNNFNACRNVLLPNFDQTFSALMEDLDQRGLLDETLVAVLSDFGRTPRINKDAGRDHWTYCYSALLCGAGVRGGTVYGASDAQAAYVKDLPVRPADICATIYRCLGIDPHTPVYDRAGRPHPVAQGGEPLNDILA
jgi:hypothetical protein